MANRCRDCLHFINRRKFADFMIGHCASAPFALYKMESDQFAIECGHDGPVIVGEDFGCIHFKDRSSV